MHNLFLGTAKRVTQTFWLEKQILSTSDLQTIHKRLSNIAVPSDLGRLPQHIESRSTFTAQQWKNWVLYFSCLFDLLPSEHLRCWQSFVLACRRHCQASISQADITIANGLLLKFCRKCVELYGPLSIIPNMHLHCHLAECILDFGPSHSFWLFAFERCNGILGKEPNNNRSIELQLTTRFLKDNLSLLFLSASEDSPHAEYFKDIVFNHDHFNIDHLVEVDRDETDIPEVFVPAKKSCIGYLSVDDVKNLQFLYCRKYPELRSGLISGAIEVPSSYNKFTHAFVKGKKVSSASENAKQPYVLATPTVPFTIDAASDHMASTTRAAEVLFLEDNCLLHYLLLCLCEMAKALSFTRYWKTSSSMVL